MKHCWIWESGYRKTRKVRLIKFMGSQTENDDQHSKSKGTRHRLGGISRQGIDCSGFVKAVYKDVFNINLPRTTKAQAHQGKSVSLNELQPGDLIFFKPANYPLHVGIFLDRSQFVHASKTKGISISKIDAHYRVNITGLREE